MALRSHVAAFMIKEDRWYAGKILMQLANPEQWPGLIEALY